MIKMSNVWHDISQQRCIHVGVLCVGVVCLFGIKDAWTYIIDFDQGDPVIVHLLTLLYHAHAGSAPSPHRQ